MRSLLFYAFDVATPRIVYREGENRVILLVNESPPGFVQGVAEDSIERTADAYFAAASPRGEARMTGRNP